jgi:hypothetical protein
MASITFTPGNEHVDPKNHLEDELKAFLEAFTLLEGGMLPRDILKKIA